MGRHNMHSKLMKLIKKEHSKVPYNYLFIKEPNFLSQPILYNTVDDGDTSIVHKNLKSYKPLFIC
jgi:hypothetical protein